jgi:alpha-L-fucosidase
MIHMVAMALLLGLLFAAARNDDAPSPYGPVPGAQQLHWHELEFYGFILCLANS